jgi:hypothetical protein
MSIGYLKKLDAQHRHLQILEDRLLDAVEQLGIMKTEFEEIVQLIIKENR